MGWLLALLLTTQLAFPQLFDQGPERQPARAASAQRTAVFLWDRVWSRPPTTLRPGSNRGNVQLALAAAEAAIADQAQSDGAGSQAASIPISTAASPRRPLGQWEAGG